MTMGDKNLYGKLIVDVVICPVLEKVCLFLSLTQLLLLQNIFINLHYFLFDMLKKIMIQ